MTTKRYISVVFDTSNWSEEQFSALVNNDDIVFFGQGDLSEAVEALQTELFTMNKVKQTERGWAAHFVGSRDCKFRRNTLLQYNDKSIVVSTVGAYCPKPGQAMIEIGWKRYYETLVFRAIFKNGYWEADTSEELDIDSKWSICADSLDELRADVDNEADDMHEAVVNEIIGKMISGIL